MKRKEEMNYISIGISLFLVFHFSSDKNKFWYSDIIYKSNEQSTIMVIRIQEWTKEQTANMV